jgi:hypothetical protein
LAQDLSARCRSRRGYALVRPGRQADRLAQLRLEAMAGPVIYRRRLRRHRVRVVLLPVTTCPPAGTTPLERKRLWYWHNADRNQAIANVAQAFAYLDWPYLHQAGLTMVDLAEHTYRNFCWVAVLVESPEHGRQLLPLLPGWTMLDNTPPPEHGPEAGQPR